MLGLGTLGLIASRVGSFVKGVITDGLMMRLPFTKGSVPSINVVNSDFTVAQSTINSSSTPWLNSLDNNAWTISGNGQCLCTNNGNTNYIQQDVNLTSGRTYKVTWTKVGHVNGALGVSSSNGTRYGVYSASSNGTYTTFVISNGSDLRFYSTGTGAIGDISVEEVYQVASDGSGNNNKAYLKTGTALSFDGVNDYIDLPAVDNIKTIAFWVKPVSTSEGLFYLGHVGGGHNQVQTISGQIALSGVSGTIYVNNTQTSVCAINVWNRVVIVLDSQFDSPGIDVGKIFSSLYGEFAMSDLQVYDTDWTTSDIAYDYNNPQKLVTDNDSTDLTLSNLIGYWALTEGAGTVTYDSSGGGNNGTIFGSTYIKAQDRVLQLSMISWAKSTPVSNEVTLPYNPNDISEDILGNTVRVKSSALNLNGTGYAEVLDDNTLDMGTGDFSVSAWVKFLHKAQGSSYNAIYTNGGQVDAANTFGIVTLNPNKIRFLVSTDACDSTTTFNEGDWVHIVGTRDSGTTSLYINGNKTPEATNTNGDNLTTSLSKIIGYDTNANRYYNGLIDDVKVYKNKALSPDEVEQNYNATKSGHNN